MSNKERRKHERYNQEGLGLTVARRGIAGILKLNPASECLDFSLSGLHFGSNQLFNVGEKLVIDLQVRDLELREINAVVIDSMEMEPAFYCTRVRFCFEDRRMKDPKLMHGLLQIEDRLRLAREYPA